MRLVLGFDGGGTKTECVLMDETRTVLARTRSGPSNPSRVGLDSALAALLKAADKALAASGRSPTEIAAVHGGIAGVGLARAIPHLHQELRLQFPNAMVLITTDLSMALAAAGDPPSVVVIAGTGTAVIGRDLAGTFAREGGLGPVLGDPGSAYDIGRKAVVQELRRSRPEENSSLGNEILQVFHCNWVDLQDQIRANPDRILAKVYPLVANAANGGDDASRALLRTAAEELSEFVARVVETLGLREQAFSLAKTGGVFGRSPFLDDHFDALVRQIAPKASIGPLPMPIAEFAARAAVDCLDSPVINVGD